MQVSVTLFGGLRQYLPAGSSFNKCSLSFDEGDSLQQLLQKLSIPTDKPYLVMHNDTRIAPEQYADIVVAETDDIVLLPPIKGG